MIRFHTARRTTLSVLPLLLLTALPAAGRQQPGAELPARVANDAIAFYNRVATTRFVGEARVGVGSEMVGDVAVLGGPLVLAGRIRGDVLVINGPVRFEPGGRIEGDLTVLGGTVVGAQVDGVAGEIAVYRETLRFRHDGDRLAPPPAPPPTQLTTGRAFGFGRTDFSLRVHGAYNRVEGLPIATGPRLELNDGQSRVEAFAIYRTEAGIRFTARELGFLVRAEQFLDDRRTLRLGATFHSEIRPIELSGFTDREAALATFLMRRDFRDYYEAEGVSIYFRMAAPRRPLDLRLTYRDENHGGVPARGAWSLVGNDRDWRLQPMAAEGRLRTLAGEVVLDTRNVVSDPSTGWHILAGLERAVGGRLSHPPDARLASANFNIVSLDLRRYARLGPSSRLSMRVAAAGSLDGRALPPQRQFALGGEGSLPGARPFQYDCGARDEDLLLERGDHRFFRHYGCDRMALFQLEYRSLFPFAREMMRSLGWGAFLGDTGWLVFFNAGRAWSESDALAGGRTEGQSDFAVDAGLGLRFSQFGAYWALPLSGSDRGINFFVRLSPRL